MPELPDIVTYLHALEARVLGEELRRIRLANPFLLRTVAPPVGEAEGRRVVGLRRLGKQICIALEGELFVVLHLMIAGRLHWRAAGAKSTGKAALATFDFGTGTLLLTEAGTKRRAALFLFQGEEALRSRE